MKLRRLLSLLVLVLALVVLLPGAGRGATTRPPNIIFILADDLGWTDVACYGSRYYETPNIDRLAAQGMRFTNAYTCGPNCAPTRAALLTGQYGPRTGVYTVGAEPRGESVNRKLEPVPNVVSLPKEKATVAQALKAGGYATGLFGKWHLGNGPGFHPAQRGFDEAIVSAGRHFDFATVPPAEVPPGVYLADFLTDRALDFIQRHRDRPFFLYLPHFAVHTPHQAKPALVEKFRSKPGVNGHDDPVYAAMIASLDESVGRILAKLDELRLAENTVVIYSSDNGGVGGYRAAGIRGGGEHTNNAPLRGGKGMLYEGGVRVPWIVRWPGVVKPGTTCETPIASVDLFPTLNDLAGGKAPPGHVLDGVSIVPLLRSGGTGALPREAIYWHFPGYLEAGRNDWRTRPAGAIRSGDWKLLEFFEDGRVELYNLKDDLSEKNDLGAKQPEITRRLHRQLKDWRMAVHAPMPRPNPEYRQERGAER